MSADRHTVVREARVDHAAYRYAAVAPWLGALLSAAAAYLAWGAVAPLGAGAPGRVGFLSASPVAFLSAAIAAAAGWSVCRRHACGVPWLAAVTLAPWLPMPAAGGLLLWHGPVALVLLAAAGLLALLPVFARLVRGIVSRPPRQQVWLAVGLAALAYGLAAWRMQPQLPGGDEPHYLVITQSLLADRDLRIENNHRRGDYLAYTSHELKPDYLRRGLDGQIYSIHAPGTPALVLPAFALAGYPGVVAFLTLFAAAGAGLAWLAAFRLTDDTGAAWAGWAAVALSVPFFFQSFTVFPDGPGAVLVMTGVYALVVPGRLQRPGSCAAYGLALAALPWLHTRYAVIACTLGALLVARILDTGHRRAGRLLAFVAMPAASATAWFGFFHVIYGTFNPAAPYGGYTQSAWSNVPRGLSGLLIDQQFGILPNAPAYLVAIGGAWSLWRLRRRLAIELGLVVVPYAVAVATYHMWWGGRSSPGRFLVPVLLPLALPCAVQWRDARSIGRTFSAAAILASIALSLVLAWAGRGALVYNFRDGYGLWFEAIAPLVRLPLALPTVFRGSLAHAWMTAAIWGGTLVLAMFAVRRATGARTASSGDVVTLPRQRTAMVALSLAGAVTLAASASWRVTGADAIDEGRGTLRVVAALLEGAAGHGWHAALPWSASRDEIAETLTIEASSRVGLDTSSDAWSGAGVPPGRYRVLTSSNVATSTRVRVTVGRSPIPVFESMVNRGLGDQELLAFDLPAGAERLRIALDEPGPRAVGKLSLQLVAPVRLPGKPPGQYARAAMSYGATCWFLDGNAFPEPGGFWVRGESETAVVLGAKGSRAELSIAAGAVATRASVTAGTGPAGGITLAPGERRAVPVSGPGPVVVRIASSAGFRPSDRDSASKDGRWLGVFVEVR